MMPPAKLPPTMRLAILIAFTAATWTVVAVVIVRCT